MDVLSLPWRVDRRAWMYCLYLGGWTGEHGCIVSTQAGGQESMDVLSLPRRVDRRAWIYCFLLGGWTGEHDSIVSTQAGG